jgi:hypothetical protein
MEAIPKKKTGIWSQQISPCYRFQSRLKHYKEEAITQGYEGV